jgi:hypothetical protein
MQGKQVKQVSKIHMNNKVVIPMYIWAHLCCPFGPIFLWWRSNQAKQHKHY